MRRPRLAILSEAASDVRDHVRSARARRRRSAREAAEREGAAEVRRRIDETRARLKSEIPPRTD